MYNLPIRLISRIDIKGKNVIKGIHLEGLRIIGDPNKIALNYYNSGIDEIIFMDVVASLYGRNNIFDVIKKASKDIFVPITIGGGIRNLDDIIQALRSGADKVAINSNAIKDPGILKKASRVLGSQCIVLSVEAKKRENNSWEALIENGREKTGIDVIDWVKEAEKLGVGEILVTSVDNEGTKKGYDVNLINNVSKAVKVPVIACGGLGDIEDIESILEFNKNISICGASVFHYQKFKPYELKNILSEKGYNLRLEGY